MVKFGCLSALVGRKKRDKADEKSLINLEDKELESLPIKFEPLAETSEEKSSSYNILVPFAIAKSSSYNVKVASYDSPIGGEVEDVAYEGEAEYEHDDNVTLKREFYDNGGFVKSRGENDQLVKFNAYNSFNNESSDPVDSVIEKEAENEADMILSGHVSDPGTAKAEVWASPKLKRSCSNLETSDVLKKIPDSMPLSKSQSFEEMQRVTKRMTGVAHPRSLGSPNSVMTHRSADKVMLKKCSSSQILPSRSRRLWWKLFLWSHRNLHEPWTAKQLPDKPPLNQQGGYSSDTYEPNRGTRFGSGNSFTFSKGDEDDDNQSWDKDNDNHSWNKIRRISGSLPENQWVAFASGSSSSMARVDEWVKDLSGESPCVVDDGALPEDGNSFPPSPESSKLPAKTSHLPRSQDLNLPEHIAHANSVIQSLNSSSTVAHMSGIGLQVIPAIWRFSSLRSVNLSANHIVRISSGSLPKGLHTLNLSRNKLSTIEGLKELTRLRHLDLSYNKISRIGQGLSNCTLIKELYLAGNKISDVEGLHRLSKLTILDLSFNKITTTKALGQIVANYNSLLALNLLGNPIHNNISDDQLRKAVCSLLPKLAYLNKQPINPQKAREIAAESIARAALGSSDKGIRRRAVKKSQGVSSVSSPKRNAVVTRKSKHRLKSRTHQLSSLQTK
ncbi:hypothetical protein DCAR_0522002 [Daucus carota subsp. sativus]|uniref:Uncharacterized protein n=1 Tax=Daucus carota subsp. sativus TaxID=79200 RepID=A0AAF0X752_DAUCS|nr:PREDICTED: uncharacterized protein LOC108222841 [Daucus carota subsp. sativus]XP_017252258.1 PREDICTED: uncharacterized protein LOC108222841 [Daucus carota subsp. sativus]XP_017252259.1 PREDICTED: uncharacterized protein LOC108222841 [Daucus carota subsp. sativus]WOH02613.1 hypothetical protein DCAR_0522002 [Daucus carota subsp. sativus]